MHTISELKAMHAAAHDAVPDDRLLLVEKVWPFVPAVLRDYEMMMEALGEYARSDAMRSEAGEFRTFLATRTLDSLEMKVG